MRVISTTTLTSVSPLAAAGTAAYFNRVRPQDPRGQCQVEKVSAGRMDQAGWNTMFAYFGEGKDVNSPARSALGANPTGRGPESSDASAKSRK